MTKIQVNSSGKAYLTSEGKVLLVQEGGGDVVTVKNTTSSDLTLGDKVFFNTVQTNYTNIGTPNVSNDFVASGFSGSPQKYIDVFYFPASGTNFTFYGRFTYNGNTSKQAICDFDNYTSNWFSINLNSGKLCVREQIGSTSLVSGTTYDFKIEWDGSSNWTQYIKESTSDTWIEDLVITSSSYRIYIFNKYMAIGIHRYNKTEAFGGSLDLKYFKITQDNEVLWQAITPIYPSEVKTQYDVNPSSYTGIVEESLGDNLYSIKTALQAEIDVTATSPDDGVAISVE